jgi:YggT family protein
MLGALIQILLLFSNLLVTVIIIQFIASLLIIFNVVSMSNQYVSAIVTALNAILDPILRPIKRLLPDTGMIDFSPIVLIFGIKVLVIILTSLAQSSGGM